MYSKFTEALNNYHGGFFFLFTNMVVVLCLIIVLTAVVLDFMAYHQKSKVKTHVRSWVETGSMFGFFLLYYGLMRAGVGRILLKSQNIYYTLIVVGLVVMVAGCYVNVKGRLKLKHNWANQVTIYTNQTLVTDGVYRIVRHPLYASIIWMLMSGCLIYSNFIALLSTVFVFIPMMYYRARQEEKVLSSEFKGYQEYRQRVGMFFPKLLRK
jgi:protein-S-isoprenylcysteine O-methyltransferase Ste14